MSVSNNLRHGNKTLEADAQKREIYRAITVFHPPGDVFEIRALRPSTPKCRLWEGFAGGKSVIYGYFDDPIKATELAFALDAHGFEGIYQTLNSVNPALLSRAANRLKVGEEKSTTADKYIPKLRRLLVDIDPERPALISSTDEEHQAALDHAQKVRGILSSRGWPEPLYGDSGNGAHLVYPIEEMDNTVDNVQILKRTLEALNDLYQVAIPAHSGGHIHLKIDCSVFNPARITKLYGTHARKGDSTPDRLHRMARIIEVVNA